MENRNETEQAILLSAEKEFMLKGLAGARTTEIAKGANVTHTMLHYYFRTKEALFLKVIERKFSSLLERVEKVLNNNDVEILTKLELLLETHFNFLVENPRLPMVVISDFYPGSSNDSTSAGISIVVLKKLHDIIFDKCQLPIREAIEQGRMRPVTLDNILIDMVGLNLASVGLMVPFTKLTDLPTEKFLKERLEENKKTLRFRITP